MAAVGSLLNTELQTPAADPVPVVAPPSHAKCDGSATPSQLSPQTTSAIPVSQTTSAQSAPGTPTHTATPVCSHGSECHVAGAPGLPDVLFCRDACFQRCEQLLGSKTYAVVENAIATDMLPPKSAVAEALDAGDTDALFALIDAAWAERAVVAQQKYSLGDLVRRTMLGGGGCNCAPQCSREVVLRCLSPVRSVIKK